MTGSRLGRRLVATHLLVVAVSLLVLAAGAAAGLPAAASVAVAVGAGSVLGAVLAVRTARWISGPLQEVGGALFTSLSGQNTPQLGEGAERLVRLLDDLSVTLPVGETNHLETIFLTSSRQTPPAPVSAKRLPW